MQALIDTMNSFIDNCKDPSRIQFCLKFDTDDTESISRLNELPKANIRTLIYDRGLGYNDLHTFYNDLSSDAKGDWLWLFNDDARMITKDWDEILANIDPFKYNPTFKGNSDVCLINPGIPGVAGSDVFPMIRRRSYEIMGHFSLHSHNDCWIQEVFPPLGVELDVPELTVVHLFTETKDTTRDEGLVVQRYSMDNYLETRKERDDDKEKLRKHI
jgi:hypothetical protein